MSTCRGMFAGVVATVSARKLNNLRKKKICFKTLWHFKGTMEYHKTMDIIHVKRVLGHKHIENTMVCINLEAAVFQTPNDHPLLE